MCFIPLKRSLLILGVSTMVGTLLALEPLGPFGIYDQTYVESFEDGASLENWTVGAPSVDGSRPTTIEIQDDPTLYGQGKVLAIVAGENSNTSIVFDLEELALNLPLETSLGAGIYFKVMRPEVENGDGVIGGILDATIGMVSSQDYGGSNNELEQPSWGEYTSYVRYVSSREGLTVANSDNAFFDTSETHPGPSEAGVWYEIWMIHDFEEQSYSVYARGGDDFPSRTLLTKQLVVEDSLTKDREVLFEGDKIDFHKSPTNPLDWFMIRYSAHEEKGIHDMYIDDIVVGWESLWETPRLINISTRAYVGSGNNVLIGGFYVDGDKPMEVLIRGVGAELAGVDEAGLASSGLLLDPTIRLAKPNGDEIVSTDWGLEANATDVAHVALQLGALTLDSNSKSAAMLVTLDPGLYTVTVESNGGEGVALVEVYEVP